MFRTTLVFAVLCLVLAVIALGTLLPSLPPPAAAPHLALMQLIMTPSRAVDVAVAAIDGGSGGEGRIPPETWCNEAGDRRPCYAPTGL